MFKSPLVVEIEDVVALVGLKPLRDWNEDLQRQAFRTRQQYLLNQFELYMHQAELLEQSQEPGKPGSASFSQKIIDRIINNVRVSVKRVYIRFEDCLLFDPRVTFGSFAPSTGDEQVISEGEEEDEAEDDMAGLLGKRGAGQKKGAAKKSEKPPRGLPKALNPSSNKFAIGIKLKELSVVTCDDEFNEVADANKLPKKADGAASCLTFKKATIDGLSVFVDWMDNGDDYLKSEEEREESLQYWDMYQSTKAPEGGQRPGLTASLAQLRAEEIDLEDKFAEILDGEFSPENQGEEASVLFRHKYILKDLHIEAQLQLNKDVKNLVLPATSLHPQIKLLTRVGSSEEDEAGVRGL